jgi:luciferase-like monooxygenase
MRIGLMVGSEKERPRADRLAGLISDGAAAESGGFTTFWMPQVPGYLDAMTAVTLIGQATDRIEIGTAVVPIQTRHPLIMAQQALTTLHLGVKGELHELLQVRAGKAQRVNPHSASFSSVLRCSAGSSASVSGGAAARDRRSPISVMACTGQSKSARMTAS